MKACSGGVLAVLLAMTVATTAAGSDPRFVRMWEEAQRDRPADLASVSRIASPGEPGQALIVRGEVLRPDRRPAVGVVVFAYQTDSGGLYARPASTTPWRPRRLTSI